jgi:hypothetical protein
MCIKSFRELKNSGTLAEDIMYQIKIHHERKLHETQNEPYCFSLQNTERRSKY